MVEPRYRRLWGGEPCRAQDDMRAERMLDFIMKLKHSSCRPAKKIIVPGRERRGWFNKRDAVFYGRDLTMALYMSALTYNKHSDFGVLQRLISYKYNIQEFCRFFLHFILHSVRCQT